MAAELSLMVILGGLSAFSTHARSRRLFAFARADRLFMEHQTASWLGTTLGRNCNCAQALG